MDWADIAFYVFIGLIAAAIVYGLTNDIVNRWAGRIDAWRHRRKRRKDWI